MLTRKVKLGNFIHNINNYQEIINVTTTITILYSMKMSGNNFKMAKNCQVGQRCFSSLAKPNVTEHLVNKGPDDEEKLTPIILPQFDLISIIYSFIFHTVLFVLLIREKFFIALCIIFGCFGISFVYYFFFENKERIRAFLMQM